MNQKKISLTEIEVFFELVFGIKIAERGNAKAILSQFPTLPKLVFFPFRILKAFSKTTFFCLFP